MKNLGAEAMLDPHPGWTGTSPHSTRAECGVMIEPLFRPWYYTAPAAGDVHHVSFITSVNAGRGRRVAVAVAAGGVVPSV